MLLLIETPFSRTVGSFFGHRMRADLPETLIAAP